MAHDRHSIIRGSGSRVLLTVGAIATSLAAAPIAADEPVIGGPCEGCELVFVGMPGSLSSKARTAPPGEPGEPMVIEGQVRDAAGRPAPGVIVYAYHTDAEGIYPEAETAHGRLRAWVRTDSDGQYRFTTIRPGAYPGGTIPEHIHLHVVEPGRATYWVDGIEFLDDPLLDPSDHEQDGRGGSGLVEPTRRNGVWHVRRDLILGRNIPGYARLDR